ncbi:MAG: hypothetical protein HQK58_02490 [Deltaproteobacteria bacterium]|nr:hypothetical protein [Deltaproteobacteria bacterium]
MNTATDMIKVDSKVAAAYNAAPPNYKKGFNRLLRFGWKIKYQRLGMTWMK